MKYLFYFLGIFLCLTGCRLSGELISDDKFRENVDTVFHLVSRIHKSPTAYEEKKSILQQNDSLKKLYKDRGMHTAIPLFFSSLVEYHSLNFYAAYTHAVKASEQDPYFEFTYIMQYLTARQLDKDEEVITKILDNLKQYIIDTYVTKYFTCDYLIINKEYAAAARELKMLLSQLNVADSRMYKQLKLLNEVNNILVKHPIKDLQLYDFIKFKTAVAVLEQVNITLSDSGYEYLTLGDIRKNKQLKNILDTFKKCENVNENLKKNGRFISYDDLDTIYLQHQYFYCFEDSYHISGYELLRIISALL
jgi:hypothetical protein